MNQSCLYQSQCLEDGAKPGALENHLVKKTGYVLPSEQPKQNRSDDKHLVEGMIKSETRNRFGHLQLWTTQVAAQHHLHNPVRIFALEKFETEYITTASQLACFEAVPSCK